MVCICICICCIYIYIYMNIYIYMYIIYIYIYIHMYNVYSICLVDNWPQESGTGTTNGPLHTGLPVQIVLSCFISRPSHIPQRRGGEKRTRHRRTQVLPRKKQEIVGERKREEASDIAILPHCSIASSKLWLKIRSRKASTRKLRWIHQ